MIKYQDYLFPFLHHLFLPSYNNSSDRAIRNMNIKMKVSGVFKIKQGAQDFATILSIIDTWIYNNKNVF